MTWSLVQSEAILDTQWLRVLRNAYRLPDGSALNDYYVIERSDFVLVVAGDAENVVLVRQYRPATGQFYYSLPAGYTAPQESPEESARRELLEETGLIAADTRVIGHLHPLPGYVKSAALIVKCTGISGTLHVNDPGEIQDAMVLSWPRVRAMIRSGQLNEMQAVAALLLARELQFAEEV